jgi:CRP/FNR family transcriptional regulator, cyclic AMP receptor protein
MAKGGSPMGRRTRAAKGSILRRFEGDGGSKVFADVLRTNAGVLTGDAAIAAKVPKIATLVELAQGDFLIRQDDTDNDLFIVLSGTFRVFVNGCEIAERGPGQHLGEMAIIDPSSRRTATIIASAPSLVAKIAGADFIALANEHPNVWRAIALELCRRLDARKKFHRTPNSTPRVFIGSSSESLPRAQAFKSSVEAEAESRKLDIGVTIWCTGVFGASSFPIDDLEVQLGLSDFAVLVCGADDKVKSRGKRSDAPRDNVIFELGLFMGALSRARTFLLVPRGVNVKIPSDLLGLTPLQYDPEEPDSVKALSLPAGEFVEVVSRKGAK